MHRDTFDADRPQPRQQLMADAVQRLRRSVARAKVRPAKPQTNNALASFGMIIGLLLVWAMAVSM